MAPTLTSSTSSNTSLSFISFALATLTSYCSSNPQTCSHLRTFTLASSSAFLVLSLKLTWLAYSSAWQIVSAQKLLINKWMGKKMNG